MTWQDESIPALRVLIGDMDTSAPTYSDDRLEQTLIVAANIIAQEISAFHNTYTVSVENSTISPDPIVDKSDLVFTNMMILKAACIVDISTLRTKSALEGIKASLGPANIQVTGHLAGFKMLLDTGPCATYADLKKQLQFNNTNMVKAVMPFFSGNRFDARYLQQYFAAPTERSFRTV